MSLVIHTNEKIKQWLAQCQHPDGENLFDTLSLLGLPAHIKTMASDLEVHDLLRQGLPMKCVRSLIKKTGFSIEELSVATSLSARVLRRFSEDKSRSARLSPQHSEVLWRLAKVFVKTQQVMGTAEYAREWLCWNVRALRYRKPIDPLSLSPGAELVLRVLHQLQHGVFI